MIVAVFDATPCRPVMGANVSVDASPLSTQTGPDGIARFESVSLGTYRVVADVAGCKVTTVVKRSAASQTVVAIDVQSCRQRMPLAPRINI